VHQDQHLAKHVAGTFIFLGACRCFCILKCSTPNPHQINTFYSRTLGAQCPSSQHRLWSSVPSLRSGWRKGTRAYGWWLGGTCGWELVGWGGGVAPRPPRAAPAPPQLASSIQEAAAELFPCLPPPRRHSLGRWAHRLPPGCRFLDVG